MTFAPVCIVNTKPLGRMGNLRKSGVYFDTRETPWYTTVKDTRARYWTEPFLGAVERLLGVALSAPVFNEDGSFAGVCNVRLIFTALSDWMNSLRLGDNGRAFIIDATGHLIAASGGVSPIAIGADGKHLRLPASEAADPIVRETARHLGRHPEIAGSSSTGPRVVSFDDPERGRIYAAVDRFEAPGEIKWSIISAVPASDFLGPVYRAAYLSIVIGTVLVAVFVVLGLWVVGRTLRPLTALTQAAQAIAKGEWRDLPEVRRNDEVGLLAQAEKAEPGGVLVVVRDSGPGLAPATLERLFEAFYTTDPGRFGNAIGAAAPLLIQSCAWRHSGHRTSRTYQPAVRRAKIRCRLTLVAPVSFSPLAGLPSRNLR